MTVRLALTIATLAGLGVLACPAAGISKTRILSLGGDVPGFWDLSADARCCSVASAATRAASRSAVPGSVCTAGAAVDSWFGPLPLAVPRSMTALNMRLNPD